MKIYEEISLKDFRAWSDAKITLEILIKIDKVEEVENYLESITEYHSDTEINDFLRFEDEFIFCELLGFSYEDWQALYE